MINSSRFDFSRAVKQTLNYQVAITAEAISVVIPQVAKESVKQLKAVSKEKFGGTGEYAKNWKWKYEKGRLKCEAIVYGGMPTYRIAHLLEHGHARRGGGRDVPGREHIAKVDRWANDEAVDRIIEYLERKYSE